MLEAAEEFPINLGFLGKGNASAPDPLREQIAAGAIGLKLHEDWGTTPAAIDCALSVADEYDVQVAIHTDTLNEAGFVEDSIRAFKGRTIHTYHTEGAGGGHAPDIIRVCGEPNCLPSSTNPTMPFTVNTMDEHLDMLMVCHHLNARDPRGPGLRRVAHPRRDDRRRGRAARSGRHQHDVVRLAGHGAHRRGDHPHLADGRQDEDASAAPLPGETSGDDNRRVKRYVAKYTINPAIAHGMAEHVGSIEVGQARRPRAVEAGLLRRQAGAGGQGRPDRVGGHGRSQRLDPDAAAGALPADVRRVRPRAQLDVGHVRLGGRAGGRTFRGGSGSRGRRVAVGRCRGLGKRDMIHNDALPRIEVDPETYEVRADGERLDVRAGAGASDGAALLPVLMGDASAICAVGLRTSLRVPEYAVVGCRAAEIGRFDRPDPCHLRRPFERTRRFVDAFARAQPEAMRRTPWAIARRARHWGRRSLRGTCASLSSGVCWELGGCAGADGGGEAVGAGRHDRGAGARWRCRRQRAGGRILHVDGLVRGGRGGWRRCWRSRRDPLREALRVAFEVGNRHFTLALRRRAGAGAGRSGDGAAAHAARTCRSSGRARCSCRWGRGIGMS